MSRRRCRRSAGVAGQRGQPAAAATRSGATSRHSRWNGHASWRQGEHGIGTCSSAAGTARGRRRRRAARCRRRWRRPGCRRRRRGAGRRSCWSSATAARATSAVNTGRSTAGSARTSGCRHGPGRRTTSPTRPPPPRSRRPAPAGPPRRSPPRRRRTARPGSAATGTTPPGTSRANRRRRRCSETRGACGRHAPARPPPRTPPPAPAATASAPRRHADRLEQVQGPVDVVGRVRRRGHPVRGDGAGELPRVHHPRPDPGEQPEVRRRPRRLGERGEHQHHVVARRRRCRSSSSRSPRTPAAARGVGRRRELLPARRHGQHAVQLGDHRRDRRARRGGQQLDPRARSGRAQRPQRRGEQDDVADVVRAHHEDPPGRRQVDGAAAVRAGMAERAPIRAGAPGPPAPARLRATTARWTGRPPSPAARTRSPGSARTRRRPRRPRDRSASRPGPGLYWSGRPSKNAVAIPPGTSSVTPTWPASSVASARVIPTTPNFEAQYARGVGQGPQAQRRGDA